MRSTVVTKLSLQMLAAPQDGGACAVNPYVTYPPNPFSVKGICVSDVQKYVQLSLNLSANVSGGNYSHILDRMSISLTLIICLL